MNTKCPICGSQTNRTGATVSCRCGWYKSFNQAGVNRLQKSIVINLLAAGFLLMGSVVYISQWGSASWSIIPLKARAWTGMLNSSSYAQLEKICTQLKKYSCVEGAHRSYFKSSADLNALSKLGDFQYRRGLFSKANNTYKLYFTKKGRGVKPAYNYARVLEKLGRNSRALEYYKYALKAEPAAVQVSVMRAYINLLVKEGLHARAKKELNAFEMIVKRSTSLVQQEYKVWKNQAQG